MPALKIRIEHETTDGITTTEYGHYGELESVANGIASTIGRGGCLVADAHHGHVVLPAARVLNVTVAYA